MELFLQNVPFFSTQKKWREVNGRKKNTAIKILKRMGCKYARTHTLSFSFWFYIVRFPGIQRNRSLLWKNYSFEKVQSIRYVKYHRQRIFLFFHPLLVSRWMRWWRRHSSLFSKWTTTIPEYLYALKRSHRNGTHCCRKLIIVATQTPIWWSRIAAHRIRSSSFCFIQSNERKNRETKIKRFITAFHTWYTYLFVFSCDVMFPLDIFKYYLHIFFFAPMENSIVDYRRAKLLLLVSVCVCFFRRCSIALSNSNACVNKVTPFRLSHDSNIYTFPNVPAHKDKSHFIQSDGRENHKPTHQKPRTKYQILDS